MMRVSITFGALAAVVAAIGAGASDSMAQARPLAAVTIDVVVTGAGANEDTVFIAGSLLTPPWRADGMRMQRTGQGRYSVTLNLPVGATLEYKFTRGSWQTVEKSAAGTDINNRRLIVGAGNSVTDTVVRWGSANGGAGGAGARSGSGTTSSGSSLTGKFVMHPSFESAILTNRRNVHVYLPPGYDQSTTTRYPVLYMHDGQNIFDRATAFGGREWQIDETVEQLIRERRIEPIIVVGIWNTASRMSEYTPVGSTAAVGRSGDDYTRFVVSELKPFIDSSYRTRTGRDDTAIAGSSLGGLISLGMAMRHPEVFGKAGVVSPSLFWNDGQLIREAARLAPTGVLARVRWWVDIGTREGAVAQGDSISGAVRNTRRLVEVFQEAGLVDRRDYFYLEVRDGEHNEAWWSRRMDQMLTALFPLRLSGGRGR